VGKAGRDGRTSYLGKPSLGGVNKLHTFTVAVKGPDRITQPRKRIAFLRLRALPGSLAGRPRSTWNLSTPPKGTRETVIQDQTDKMFTEDMVHKALQTWCDNVVAVGRTHADGDDARTVALKVLTEHYDYDSGKVLFKPTLAFGKETFRPTKQGALAYFVGGDENFPDDKGFKLKPWVKVWYSKEDHILHGDLAIVQCNVHFIGADDSHIFVNKSFVFKHCLDGNVRIILHQSSLPYQP
jgi:hypothetical protein